MAVTELRKVISDYLDNSIDLPEFASRFAHLSYGIRESGDSFAAYFCRAVESRIAEVHLKLISELRFREAVRSYYDQPFVTIEKLVIVNSESPDLVSSPLAGEVEYEVCA